MTTSSYRLTAIKKHKIILVLGPHRSGTSTVAGILHYGGIYMGTRLIGPHPSNPRGHFENLDFVLLNDKIIGDWRNPQKRPLAAAEIGKYRFLFRGLQQYPIAGIKDPRFCVTAQQVMRYCMSPVTAIAVDRDPLCAACSLSARDHMGLDQAGYIIGRYFEAREQFLQAFLGPVLRVNYDEICEDSCGEVIKILEFAFADTELGPTPQQLKQALVFVDPNLRHWTKET